MRVLICGGGGFIGGHLLKHIHDNKLSTELFYTTRGAKKADISGEPFFGDLSNVDDVQYVLGRARPDVLYHFAGKATTKGSPDEMFHSNVLSTYNLLKYCRPETHVVLASSATVYGDLGQKKACEETDPCEPSSDYGASKLAAEALVKGAAAMGRCKATILRFCAVVGPGAGHGLLPDLKRKILSDSETLDLLGEPPGSVKPFIHVDDVVKYTAALGFSKTPGTFNVGRTGLLSVQNIADVAMQLFGRKKPLRWLPQENFRGDNRCVCLDVSKAGLDDYWQNSGVAVRKALEEMAGHSEVSDVISLGEVS